MDAGNNEAARSLVTTRLFDAPRDLVFEAWTHPNHLSHWWGPAGFSITTRAFDFRPGGVWRLVMHGPDGRDYQNHITFDEIVAPERISFHHSDADGAESAHHRTVVTFEDAGGKTKLTMRLVFSSAEERDRVVREYGAAEGLKQTVGRLGDYVAGWEGNAGLEKHVTLSRFFKAPRALVFEAFTNPKHLAQWWGPKGFVNPVCEIDARPGGAILIHMEMEGGHFSHPMTGIVHEVKPPERFVFTAVARGAQNEALLESHTTITFHEEGGGTRLTVEARAKGLVPMARMMLAGMREGWSQSLDKLEALVVR
ncbi:MAG TPA: SRPBCC family protein [Rhizomicrobium sp.]|nr:SRPBCC family protein [Rhizomicrobium sp.]